MNDKRSVSFTAAILLLAFSINSHCLAEDHLLSIGGGSHPSNTQVSLEKNILFLQSYLHGAGLDPMPHEILFGDGNGSERDVQFDDPNLKLPPVNDLLARIFNHDHLLSASFRPHEIPHLWGAATRDSLNKWFDTIGSKLGEGDRLIVYYTGHGGRGSGQGTTFVLWNENEMPVREFSKLLDKIPARVPVILVMVQCFSGGFADLIYTDADPAKGLAKRTICGFFATLPDRTAAGCTADIDEEDYREYSTYFWAALAGRTRTGKTVASADYDHDGKISFSEAHAYSLINSDTVDISMKSSDVLLRKFSRTRLIGKGAIGPPLVTAQDDFQKLLSTASPADTAVLNGLAKVLKVEGPRPVMAAIRLADDLQKQRKTVGDRQSKLENAHRMARNSIEQSLKHRWPELGNLLNPNAAKIMAEQGDAIVKFIHASPRFGEFEDQEKQLNAAEKESMDFERTWVKTQRFIRTAENVALAANLPSVASPETVQRYRELIAAEGAVFDHVGH